MKSQRWGPDLIAVASLQKEMPELPPSLSSLGLRKGHVRTQREGGVCRSEEGWSLETESVSTLVSDVLPPKRV